MKSYSRNPGETHEAFEARVETAELNNGWRAPFLDPGKTATSIARTACSIIFSRTPRVLKEEFYDQVWELSQYQWSRYELSINRSEGASGHARWRKSTEQFISKEKEKGNLRYLDRNGKLILEGRKNISIYEWIGPPEVLYPYASNGANSIPATEVYVFINIKEEADPDVEAPEIKIGKSGNALARFPALQNTFAPDGGRYLIIWKLGNKAGDIEKELKRGLTEYNKRKTSKEFFRLPRNMLKELVGCSEDELVKLLLA